MKRFILAAVLLCCIVFPAFSFECFGVKSGDSITKMKLKRTKFIEKVDDNGVYQAWIVQPAKKNRLDDFNYYIFYVDNEYGLFWVQAFTDIIPLVEYQGDRYFALNNTYKPVRNKLVAKYGEPSFPSSEDEDIFDTWRTEEDEIWLVSVLDIDYSETRANILNERILRLSYTDNHLDELVMERYRNNQLDIL